MRFYGMRSRHTLCSIQGWQHYNVHQIPHLDESNSHKLVATQDSKKLI